MKTNLIIGRHPYGSLKGAKRMTIALSPGGAAELDLLATCSKAAVVDLAVKVLGRALNPQMDKSTAVTELVNLARHSHNAPEQLNAIAANFFNLAQELEMHADRMMLDLTPV